MALRHKDHLYSSARAKTHACEIVAWIYVYACDFCRAFLTQLSFVALNLQFLIACVN